MYKKLLLVIVMLLSIIVTVPFEHSNDIKAATNNVKEMANVVIFAYFQDSTNKDYFNNIKTGSQTNGQWIQSLYNGSQGRSLTNYINTISNGKLKVHNIFPQYDAQTGKINALELKYNENYATTSFIDSLILTQIRDQVSLDGLNVDYDNDGVIDHVSVVMLGGDSATNSAVSLWPHKYTTTEYWGNKKMNVYNFQSTSHINEDMSGVICHEFMHSLGLPDLYKKDKSSYPVHNWDMMGFTTKYVAYPLTYLRSKHAGWVDWIDIDTISSSQSLTLYSQGQGGHQSYIIESPINKNEVFVVELRNKAPYKFGDTDQDSLDSAIGGTGVIVYRINKLSKDLSNFNGQDNVYVFRPQQGQVGYETDQEKNLNNAYLPYTDTTTKATRNTIGSSEMSHSLADGALTYMDGTNSGIVIENIQLNSDKKTATMDVRVPTNTQISEKIKKVNMLGIISPTIGQKPSTSVTTDTADVSVANVSWNTSGSIFDYNKEYSISFELIANNGKEFADDVSVSLLQDSNFTVVKKSNTKLKVTKNFKVILAPEISITETSSTLTVGESLQLNVEDKTNSRLTWTSSDSRVASVDSKGLVNALAEGTTTISVKNSYGKQASIVIRVKAKNIVVTPVPTPTYIQDVTLADIQLPVVGQTPQQTITTKTPDVCVENVQWTPITTTFDYEKEYTITATLKAINHKVFHDTVTVNRGLYSVQKIDETTLKITKTFKKINAPDIVMTQLDTTLTVNETLQLSVNDSTNTNLTWTSSDARVASVDSKGLLYALAEGETTITATNIYGKQAKVTITVVKKNEIVTPNPTPAVISKVTLGNIEAPIIGKSAQHSVELLSDDVTVVSMEWTPASNAFTYDTAYKVIITLQAKQGYIFDSSSVVKNKDFTFNIDKIDGSIMTVSYTFPKTPAVLLEEIQYPILNGDNSIVVKDEQNNSNNMNSDVSVRVDAAITTFRSVYLNGKLLDPKYYTVTEGSTIITLHPSYVETLPTGKYQLEIVFEAGYAQAQFEIRKQENSNSNLEEDNIFDNYLPSRPSLPNEALQDQLSFIGTNEGTLENKKEQQTNMSSHENIETGDKTNYTLWIISLFVALVVLVSMIIKRKIR